MNNLSMTQFGRSRVSWAARAVLLSGALLAATPPARAQSTATATEGDFVAHDFRFEDGSTLPDLKLHYETLGTAHRDPAGNSTMLASVTFG